ncbi:MAG: prepilin-type N-terminal cleavage/methylation domain-containing protein [Rickettsiales bacterium]|nr:prepilin-type N-terminal cleavage/methylation domain-containing protein [Pseudomonadota bacterium]MDA0965830.1 prepilin-type N-terminal cleavage/methylation domain-containing protein [Pseudomonadota bacterium]MDG4542700.1 prepilin-type N-terminal cleavage/methylation domain-containing protein [Rickettsiales bacterium]MDG4545204.1 prepilin-type N-terminal cleavage/methylation domain-containing protein [Rickettsiales bacterium]MDG4547327.1 prepilin-type N-terminal cleavage/methylation domain-c
MVNEQNNKGFTLIELSIVIVIIGLIVAGVVGGQAIVRQAKVRAVISDYNQTLSSINAFNLEYNGLPGDFNRAAAYGIGGDGDGNKKIQGQTVEGYYAWQHLSNAGLISGSYTGLDAGNPDYQMGINIPGSSYGGSVAIHLSYIGSVGSNCLTLVTLPLFGVINETNVITFGAIENAPSGCPRDGFLRVSEAHGIDTKIDDGSPDSGIMFSANTRNLNVNGDRCVDNRVQGTGGANYDFDEEGNDCRILFRF